MVTIVRGRDTKAQIVHRPGVERQESPTAKWVPTTCRKCLVGCGVLVKVEDGRVVNVIGNPDAPKNRGRMCAKGKSGIMTHYNHDDERREIGYQIDQVGAMCIKLGQAAGIITLRLDERENFCE